MLPQNISLLVYSTIILPHINYLIRVWGHHHKIIAQLQKRAIRVITIRKYLAHTEPLFKNLNVLKVEDFLNFNNLNFTIDLLMSPYLIIFSYYLSQEIHTNIELERGMSYSLFEYILNLLKRAFYTVFLLL